MTSTFFKLSTFILTLVIGDWYWGTTTVFSQGPENTLVVVNAASTDSLAIANHYVELRDIPPVNVVYVRDIVTIKNDPESCTSREFRTKILEPILKMIKDRGTEKQIACVAYSAGFPTRVNFQPEMKDYLAQTGKKYSLMLHAPFASLTSLTYLNRKFTSKLPDFLELDANNYANPRRMKVSANPFVGNDASKFTAAISNTTKGKFEEAITELISLGRKHPNQISVVFALARCFALKGDVKKTINTLKYAGRIGFASRSLLQSDKAFDQLQSNQEFKEIAQLLQDLPDGSSPSRSFSSREYLGPNGWPNGTPDQGERYLLCSVLAVTGKNQSTLENSMQRLTTSAQVDGAGEVGEVYFADHTDPRSRTRRSQFTAAVKELEALGIKGEIGKNIYPINNQHVIGATLGSPVIDWKKSGSRFLPGAICDNMTSAGGNWKQGSQTYLSKFLDAGAAGASGTVYEPFTIQAKFPTARWHAHYTRGCTLAESFYQTVAGPFQLLIVGDPLCCPFGEFPDFEIDGVEDSGTVKGDFSLSLKVREGSTKVSHFDVYYDGQYYGAVSDPELINVATDDMNDGYHELRIVGVADSPVATKRSKKLGFFLDRKGQSVSLNIENEKAGVGSEIVGKASSTVGRKIEVQQNMRTLATTRSGVSFRIPAKQLGKGPSHLRAIVTLEDGTIIQSEPVIVQIQGQRNDQEDNQGGEQSSGQAADGNQGRRQVPAQKDVKQAILSIRDLLKDQYQDKTPKGRKSLLNLLQKTANESIDDPVNHFALLSESINGATVFGDVDAGWSACNQIEENYDVSVLPHIDFIKRVKNQLTPQSANNLHLKGVSLVRKRIAEDRYKEASDLAKTLGKYLRRLTGAKSTYASMVKQSNLLAKEFKQIQDDLKILTKNPKDVKANDEVGKFYFLHKEDFKKAIPYFAKGVKGPIRDLAAYQLSLESPSIKESLAIADRWWELSRNKETSSFKLIAANRYRNIVGSLDGLDKIRVEKRIEELNSTVLNAQTTLTMLARFKWRVEWKSLGWVWDNVALQGTGIQFQSRPATQTINTGTTQSYKIHEIPGGIEIWKEPKTVSYQIVLSDNNQLICTKLNSKNKVIATGVGYPTP